MEESSNPRGGIRGNPANCRAFVVQEPLRESVRESSPESGPDRPSCERAAVPSRMDLALVLVGAFSALAGVAITDGGDNSATNGLARTLAGGGDRAASWRRRARIRG